MIVWGVFALLQIGGVKVFKHGSNSTIAAWLRRGISLVGNRPPVVRAATVGLLSGVLPCGWLWAFVVTAAGTGSALGGVAVMAVFWAGTVPILLALGLGAQILSIPLRRHIPAVTAVILVALGLYAIIGRPDHRAGRHEEAPARRRWHRPITRRPPTLLRRLKTSSHNRNRKAAKSKRSSNCDHRISKKIRVQEHCMSAMPSVISFACMVFAFHLRPRGELSSPSRA